MADTDVFSGDSTYAIECAGEVIVGDEIAFSRGVFTGAYPACVFIGYETVRGTVISCGSAVLAGNRLYTMRTLSGARTRIAAHNIYKHGVWRKPWDDEAVRRQLTASPRAGSTSLLF